MSAVTEETVTIRPFAVPDNNFVRVHNYLFDTIMPDLDPATWKVLCFILRKLHGWKKDQDELAYSQIKKGTGIDSKNAVSRAIKTLLDKQYITRITRPGKTTCYQLNEALEVTIIIQRREQVKRVPVSK